MKNPIDTFPAPKQILEIQKSRDIKQSWEIFLKSLNIPIEPAKSYLIVQTSFYTVKLIVENGKISEKKLIEFQQGINQNDDAVNRYDFNPNQQTLTGQWQLPFAEVFFSVFVTNIKRIEEKIEHSSLDFLIHLFINHIELITHIQHLKSHSIKDDLTLLFNQNYLKSFIDREINRSKRYKLKFSVIFFDLDHLKEINEEHGHLIGTEVLKEVSRLLSNSLRKIDIVARFGGDEFVIVLADTDPVLSLKICQRLRDTLNKEVFLKEQELNLKISGCFGIANFPDHGQTVEELIKRADMAMYDVKHSGKDGIKVYEGV